MGILAATALILVAPPLVGALLGGIPLARFLEFPPVTRYVDHAAFSWPVFLGMAAVIGMVATALVALLPHAGTRPPPGLGYLDSADRRTAAPGPPHRFPVWGWIGALLTACAWAAAWMRPAWLGPLRDHTFAPLWVGFSLFLDGTVHRCKGESMLTRSPAGFLLLLPISAVTWWYFEYLNRFVQNWHYSENVSSFPPLKYFLLATPPFATVFPAVFEAAELVGCARFVRCGYRDGARVPTVPTRAGGWLMIAAGTIGLGAVPVWPTVLYPTLWLGPLLITAGLLHLRGSCTLLTACSRGDWRPMVCFALGALLCGFCWELWNFLSWPKWIYVIPHVQRFHIFEMPVLGYAGYLPFGLECYCIYALAEQAFPGHALADVAPGGFAPEAGPAPVP